jgi:hypothetical protein
MVFCPTNQPVTYSMLMFVFVYFNVPDGVTFVRR